MANGGVGSSIESQSHKPLSIDYGVPWVASKLLKACRFALWQVSESKVEQKLTPFDPLVFRVWSIFSHDPKRSTFYFQVLWASEEGYPEHRHTQTTPLAGCKPALRPLEPPKGCQLQRQRGTSVGASKLHFWMFLLEMWPALKSRQGLSMCNDCSPNWIQPHLRQLCSKSLKTAPGFKHASRFARTNWGLPTHPCFPRRKKRAPLDPPPKSPEKHKAPPLFLRIFAGARPCRMSRRSPRQL